MLSPDRGITPPLLPGEEAAVARAVEARRREFALGRDAARRALAKAGGPRVAIPAGPGRAPQWPGGWVGSITHCPGVAGAVVAPESVLAGVGLDVEVRAALEAGVVERVLHLREVAEAARSGLPEVALFGAKEAVHKALFPRSGVWMDFLDVRLVLEASSSFRAVPAGEGRETAPGLEALRGRILVEEDLTLAVAFLPAAGAAQDQGP